MFWADSLVFHGYIFVLGGKLITYRLLWFLDALGHWFLSMQKEILGSGQEEGGTDF